MGLMALALMGASYYSLPSMLGAPAAFLGRGSADKRNTTKVKGKYMPHQNDRECARRRRQMGGAA